VALHHLDAPWKPAEVEQREGRILRQGNENKEVSIYRYVTEGSFDAYMWQALETKAKFIGQVMTGENALRRAEDIGSQELSYAEVKAIASGNPAVLTLAEADAELQRLTLLKKNHLDEQYVARRNVRDLPGRIDTLKDRLTKLQADQATANTHERDPVSIGGRHVPRDDLAAVLAHRLESLPSEVSQPSRIPLGTYRGLRFGIQLHPQFPPEVFLEGHTVRQSALSREHQGPRAVLNALERLANGYVSEGERVREDLGIAESQLRDYQARIGGAFAHEDYLAELTALRDQLKASLSSANQTLDGPSPTDIAARIKALKAANTLETAPQRSERKATVAEEPVTARIRRRQQEAAQTMPESDLAPESSPDATALSFQERILRERQRRTDGDGPSPP
jgi:hypothetical protein